MKSNAIAIACIASLSSAFSAFSITPALAADWYLVVTGESGDRYFMDRDSITSGAGNPKATFFTVYQKVDDGDVGYTEDAEFDCPGNKYRSLRSTYFGEDSSVKRFGVDDKWTTPSKDRVDEVLFKEVCSFRPQ